MVATDSKSNSTVSVNGQEVKSLAIAEKPKTSASRPVKVTPLKIDRFVIPIIGLSDLITNCIGPEVRKTLKGGLNEGEIQPEKEDRDPQKEFQNSIYRMSETDWSPAFPGIGIRKALIVAAKRMGAGVGTKVAANVFVDDEMIAILDRLPKKDQATIRMEQGGKSGGLAVSNRARFERGWRMRVWVSFNASMFTRNEIVNLFEAAGFGIGIGCRRPELEGTNGRWMVDTGKKTPNE